MPVFSSNIGGNQLKTFETFSKKSRIRIFLQTSQPLSQFEFKNPDDLPDKDELKRVQKANKEEKNNEV